MDRRRCRSRVVPVHLFRRSPHSTRSLRSRKLNTIWTKRTVKYINKSTAISGSSSPSPSFAVHINSLHLCVYFIRFSWRYDRYVTQVLAHFRCCLMQCSHLCHCMHALRFSSALFHHFSHTTQTLCMRLQKTLDCFGFLFLTTAERQCKNCVDLPWTRRKCRKHTRTQHTHTTAAAAAAEVAAAAVTAQEEGEQKTQNKRQKRRKRNERRKIIIIVEISDSRWTRTLVARYLFT